MLLISTEGSGPTCQLSKKQVTQLGQEGQSSASWTAVPRQAKAAVLTAQLGAYRRGLEAAGSTGCTILTS